MVCRAVGQAAQLSRILMEKMRSEPRLAGDERISHVVIWAEGTLVPMPKGRGPAWLGRGSAQRALWSQLTEQGGEATREEATAGPHGAS